MILRGVVEFNDKEYAWFVDGIIHRDDGPAVIKKGDFIEYWLHGRCVESIEFELCYMLRYNKIYKKEE